MALTKWVAKMKCGHVIGNETSDYPVPGDLAWCPVCDEGMPVEDAVTNLNLVGPDGKR